MFAPIIATDITSSPSPVETLLLIYHMISPLLPEGNTDVENCRRTKLHFINSDVELLVPKPYWLGNNPVLPKRNAMKKLLILSIVALVATNSGCCRSWSSWWNRGASCDSCVSSMPTSTYSSGTLISPPTEVLPGPAEVVVPRG